MKKFFVLFLLSIGILTSAADARGRRGGRGWDRNHHHHHDRDRDDDDAEDAAIALGIIAVLFSSTTAADTLNDDDRAVLEDVAATIVSGEETPLLNAVLAEMDGDEESTKKELLLKKIELALAD